MREDEVTQWRQALSLFSRRLDDDHASDAKHRGPAARTDPAGPAGPAGPAANREQVEVRNKLEQLLNTTQSATDGSKNDPLESWALTLGMGINASSDAETDAVESGMIGRQLGDWVITDTLGRGGTASVYLVEKSGVEFQQSGALKLLSLLSIASNGIKRFVREQQFLAQLNHPHIATLLDGGVAKDGTPFLVMERVQGLPIDEYCRQNKLSVNAITRLVLQVCDAVGHAHSKLILHRDIKPSNVMVTRSGQLKLLDFGIGKLNDETAEGTVTRVYTPKYAAPEQKSGAAVTTATDVYGVAMLARTLLEEFNPQFTRSHSDISTVLSKAGHEEPARRYGSIEGLARDLQNCLDNRPISAVPDSAAYRLRKFAQRNRAMVISGCAIVAISLFGVLAVLWQAQTARQEALKANALSGFMISLFADGDLFSGRGPDTSISTLMREGALRARTQLAATPDAQSEVLRVVGLAQTEFGEYDQAGDNLQAALESATDELARAIVLGSIGVWLAEQSEYTKGIEKLREALNIMSVKLPASHPDRLEVETDLINFLLFTGEKQQSIERADALVAQIGSLDQLPDLDHANVLRSRAMAQTQLGHFEDAIKGLRQALMLANGFSPERPALVAAYQNDLGIVYAYKGDLANSVEVLYDSYNTQVEIYGANHKRTITSGTNLVIMLRSAGQYRRAIELGEALLTHSVGSFGEVSRSTTLARFALALVLSDNGQHLDANQQLTKSVADLRQLPELRYELPNHLSWQGEILIRLGRFEKAIGTLEESELIRATEFPDEARRYRVAAQRRLVQAHAALNECESANALLGDIQTEVSEGDPEQWLVTRIYLLNCAAENSPADTVLTEARQLNDSREKPNASLVSALQWSDERFL